MRTTINLADDVFRAYKQRAAARGTTFAQQVEDALRADLQGRHTVNSGEEPFEVLVFEGDGSPALIDIDDNRALQALTDEEDHRG
jgi:plasmid stability protein